MTNALRVVKKPIIINTLQKTGSTFLQNVLSEITGIPVKLLQDRTIDHNNFSIRVAMELREEDLISKTHSIPTTALIEYLKVNQIRPIYLIKDEQEILASLHKHALRANQKIFETQLLHEMSEEDQVKFIADKYGYEIVKFKFLWALEFMRAEISPILVKTNVMMSSKLEFIKYIISNALPNTEISDETIDNAIEKIQSSEKSNYFKTENKHVYLSNSAEKAVSIIQKNYPEVFSLYKKI